MRSSTTASFLRPIGLLAAMLLAAMTMFAPAAVAKDVPGNNGTVKIHEGADENENGEVRNEPHVCTFHLHFYFGDDVQTGTWEIIEWAPTGSKQPPAALSGTYDTMGDGEDRQPATGVYTLPDGHYKLFWDGDTSKHDKMKVFWVECAPAENGGGGDTGGGGGGGGGGDTGGGGTGGEGGTGGSGGSGGTGGTGTELPAGGVGGITATPPPTDTAPAAAQSLTNDGWLPVLLALGALAGALMFLTPARAPIRVTKRIRTPGR